MKERKKERKKERTKERKKERSTKIRERESRGEFESHIYRERGRKSEKDGGGV